MENLDQTDNLTNSEKTNSSSLPGSKSTIANVDYNRIQQSASILEKEKAQNFENEQSAFHTLFDELQEESDNHESYLQGTINEYDQMLSEYIGANQDFEDLINNSQKIAKEWQDLDTSSSEEIRFGLLAIDNYLGLEENFLSAKYDSIGASNIEFHTNATEIEGFVSDSAYLSDYYPSLNYRNKSIWMTELIKKYTDQGYSEEDAVELARLDAVNATIDATGAEGQKTAYSTIISELKDKYKPSDISNQVNDTQADTNTQQTATSSSGGYSSSTGSSNYQYRATYSTSSSTGGSSTGGSTGSVIGSSSSNNTTTGSTTTTTPSETPSTSGETSTPSETPSTSTPETSTPSGENNGTSGPIIEEEVPTEETPSTGGNTNTGNNTGTTTTTPPSTNTGGSNTNTSTSTPQGSGSNNSGGYVSSGSSNNGGNTSNAGGSFEDTTPSTGTTNENAATTTPSAPESDAGIQDNSGETLDVISIDKDTTNTPSTSSNDGGSVIPVVLGVGVAGAAVAGGAKIIHDKKNKDEMYSYDDGEPEDNNDGFSYINSYDNNSSEAPTQEAPAPKYKAGSANKLVLEDAPENINIDESAADIPSSKEELE